MNIYFNLSCTMYFHSQHQLDNQADCRSDNLGIWVDAVRTMKSNLKCKIYDLVHFTFRSLFCIIFVSTKFGCKSWIYNVSQLIVGESKDGHLYGQKFSNLNEITWRTDRHCSLFPSWLKHLFGAEGIIAVKGLWFEVQITCINVDLGCRYLLTYLPTYSKFPFFLINNTTWTAKY